MRKFLIALAVVAAPVSAEDKPALSPNEIVAAASKGDWVAIAASDLLVMDLAPDVKGRPRRVVIQLMPAPFSQGWIGNIRRLAAARWWDGLSVNRVQDNYVVQWGDGEAEDKAKAKVLPTGLANVSQDFYLTALPRLMLAREDGTRTDEVRFPVWTPGGRDAYADSTGLAAGGWPVASDGNAMWPVHCYGMVGVGRDMAPDTGSGAELYAVIGHAPRHLDRNIALVGRVIEGIEHLSSLLRGKGELGFYDLAQGDERVGIVAVRNGNEVKDLPAYEYLSTESPSFAAYAEARANRRDPFFIRPAGGADVCNIPVPVRRAQR